MTTVKDQWQIQVSSGHVDIIWYADNLGNYGVEVISEDHGLIDFLFDASIESYSISHAWYQVLTQKFTEQLLVLDGNVSDPNPENIQRLAVLLEICVRELDYDPLAPLHLSMLRASSGYTAQPEVKPDWVVAVKNKY